MRKIILGMLLIFSLCIGVLTSKAKANDLSEDLYLQYYHCIDSSKFIAAQLVDLNYDSIPEMVLINAADDPDEVCAPFLLNVYRYNPEASEAENIYNLDYSFSNLPEAQIEIGTYNDMATIMLHYTERIGQPFECYYAIYFDNNLSAHEEVQYKFSPHQDLPGGFSETEEDFNNLKNNFTKTSNLAICSDGMRFVDANNEDEAQMIFLENLTAQYRTVSKQTIKSKIANKGFAITDVINSFSDADKKELVDFMQAYNGCNYNNGMNLELKDIFPGLYSSLKIYDSFRSDYYSSHYSIEKIEPYSSGFYQGGTRISTNDFDILTLDLYGKIFEKTDYTWEWGEPYRLEFDKDYATVYYELETDFLPNIDKYDSLELMYQITDNLYYGVFAVNDNLDQPKGFGSALLAKFVRNGHTYWHCFYANQDSAYISDEILQKCMRIVSPDSNIHFNYDKIADFTSFEQYIQELELELDAIDNAPNAKALIEVADYISFAMHQCTAKAIMGRNNYFDIKSQDIQSITSALLTQVKSVEKVLAAHKIDLNMPYRKIARLDMMADWNSKVIQIKLDSRIADVTQNIDELLLYVGDNRHAVQIDAQALASLAGYTIQLQKISENAYSVSYIDASGQQVSYLSNPVTVILPAEDALASVLLIYSDKSTNWGGQYDASNQCISFEAPYTGQYSVLNENLILSDIDGLNEEYQKAIHFMVSKGYFSAPDGKFTPEMNLTRYDFAQALVKMFYAQEDDLTTKFSDVPQDSIYYPYIAAGENKDIIEGYEDNTFRGNCDVLREEVLAFCSRTLMEKKHYIAPEQPSEYLHFIDNIQISEWAQQQIALAVREGFIDDGGVLQPLVPINRADAAVLLYRLFMRLYEVSSFKSVLSDEVIGNELDSTWILLISGISMVALGSVGFFKNRRAR